MDEMYTVIAYKEKKVLKYAAEIDACLSFCLKYYEAVYGLPYSPSKTALRPNQKQVHSWIMSLSKSRREVLGRIIYTDEERKNLKNTLLEGEGKKDLKKLREAVEAGELITKDNEDRNELKGTAISDEEIKMNFKVSRNKTTRGLYVLAKALGYKGPVDLIHVRGYFSPTNKENLGIYYDPKTSEWKLKIRQKTTPDKTLKDWAIQKLRDLQNEAIKRNNITARHDGDEKKKERNNQAVKEWESMSEEELRGLKLPEKIIVIIKTSGFYSLNLLDPFDLLSLGFF